MKTKSLIKLVYCNIADMVAVGVPPTATNVNFLANPLPIHIAGRHEQSFYPAFNIQLGIMSFERRTTSLNQTGIKVGGFACWKYYH